MPQPGEGSGDLGGVGVLVTRPSHQAEPLCRLIEQAGGRPLRFPALEIAPPDHPEAARATLSHLERFDLAVFVSPNAVARGMEFIDRTGGLPQALRIAVVGAGTARELERRTGRPPDIVPAQRFDSEGLLSAPELCNPKGLRVIIIRGQGGRELLRKSLSERGARVDHAEVYCRRLPRTDPTPLLEQWRAGAVAIVSATSCEVLRNLYELLEPGRELLLATPLVVVGQRAATLASELGFHCRPVVAPEASNRGILQGVLQAAAELN